MMMFCHAIFRWVSLLNFPPICFPMPPFFHFIIIDSGVAFSRQPPPHADVFTTMFFIFGTPRHFSALAKRYFSGIIAAIVFTETTTPTTAAAISLSFHAIIDYIIFHYHYAIDLLSYRLFIIYLLLDYLLIIYYWNSLLLIILIIIIIIIFFRLIAGISRLFTIETGCRDTMLYYLMSLMMPPLLIFIWCRRFQLAADTMTTLMLHFSPWWYDDDYRGDTDYWWLLIEDRSTMMMMMMPLRHYHAIDDDYYISHLRAAPPPWYDAFITRHADARGDYCAWCQLPGHRATSLLSPPPAPAPDDAPAAAASWYWWWWWLMMPRRLIDWCRSPLSLPIDYHADAARRHETIFHFHAILFILFYRRAAAAVTPCRAKRLMLCAAAAAAATPNFVLPCLMVLFDFLHFSLGYRL